MPAYVIGQVTVHDSVEYEKYLSNFMPAFTLFSGRVLVASEEAEVMKVNGLVREQSSLNSLLKIMQNVGTIQKNIKWWQNTALKLQLQI